MHKNSFIKMKAHNFWCVIQKTRFLQMNYVIKVVTEINMIPKLIKIK